MMCLPCVVPQDDRRLLFFGQQFLQRVFEAEHIDRLAQEGIKSLVLNSPYNIFLIARRQKHQWHLTVFADLGSRFQPIDFRHKIIQKDQIIVLMSGSLNYFHTVRHDVQLYFPRGYHMAEDLLIDDHIICQ